MSYGSWELLTYDLFERALETGSKASPWQAFLACFTASTK